MRVRNNRPNRMEASEDPDGIYKPDLNGDEEEEEDEPKVLPIPTEAELPDIYSKYGCTYESKQEPTKTETTHENPDTGINLLIIRELI